MRLCARATTCHKKHPPPPPPPPLFPTPTPLSDAAAPNAHGPSIPLSFSSKQQQPAETKKASPNMGFENVWNSHPKEYGKGSRKCRVCSNQGAIIRKYGLNICRQCFRQYANDIGFIKYQ